MIPSPSSAFVWFLCLAVAATLPVHGLNIPERWPHIIYMGEMPNEGSRSSVVKRHDSLLLKAIGDEDIARESKIHSYSNSINAFAAWLLPHEVKLLSNEDEVISVFQNSKRKLLTTRSWDFLGMHQDSQQRKHMKESDIIVGLLDTGIWPDAPSFKDEGYGPPPSKWKGKCDTGTNFTGCNNKVIGARYYQLDRTFPIMEDPTPVDTDGHGSHTSSTVAGVAVDGASLYGIAKGTARGGVPSARIAMYKVCWTAGCSDIDILAAFDDAIKDGVDVISISIGGGTRDYFNDPIAIGSFHAMKKGILTSVAAGNEGPDTETVENVAPWLMTVAASSIDRQFISKLKLGDGTTIIGNGINTYSMHHKMYPLTDGLHAGVPDPYYGNNSACETGSLDENKVKGKIVYCLTSFHQDETIKELRGVGTIMGVDMPTDYYFVTLSPSTTILRYKYGDRIDKYINNTKKAEAFIYKSKTVKMNAPFVASFSSRGPQMLTVHILKPDLAAPGLNILAAYTGLKPITEYESDNRYSNFNFMSGTSMATPHAAAAAAYVKSFHPDWSPAAIKSALMTTATNMKIVDENRELSSGSGQIDPIRAIHPGIVYDINLSSYLSFLCKEGYNETSISYLIGGKKKYKCSDLKPALGTDGLNYPSMHVILNYTETRVDAVFHRTATYVGYGEVTFKAKVTSKELSVQVVPNQLRFTDKHQKLKFKVIVKGSFQGKDTKILSATLDWTSKEGHSAKSPILVYKRTKDNWFKKL